MLKSRYIIFIGLLLACCGSASAQKAERDYIRKGNRAYKDSVFVDAEIYYRKALEENPASVISMYNLGNTLAYEQKFQEAMQQYEMATKFEKDKTKLHKIYHNAGVLLQSAKEYNKAIEAYKEALRNNPKDDETRYNLALCQKLLEDQEQDQDNQDNQNQDNQEQEQEQQQQQDQQNQEQEQDQQQQPEQQENDISKENAEQMLNSVTQDEKDVQEKVRKQQQALQGGRLEKEW